MAPHNRIQRTAPGNLSFERIRDCQQRKRSGKGSRRRVLIHDVQRGARYGHCQKGGDQTGTAPGSAAVAKAETRNSQTCVEKQKYRENVPGQQRNFKKARV